MFKYFIQLIKGNIPLRIITIFNIVFVTPLFTRYLGLENYGYLSYIMSFAGFLAIASTIGIGGYLELYVPVKSSKHKSAELFYTGVIARSCFAIITITLFAIIAYSHIFDLKIDDQYIPIIMLMAFLSPIAGSMVSLLHSFLYLKVYYLLIIFNTVAGTLICICAFLFNLSIYQIMVLYPFVVIATGVPAGWVVCRRLNMFRLNFSLLREIIPSGLILTLNSTLWLLITFTDRFFIMRYLDKEVLSIYTLAGVMSVAVIGFMMSPATSLFRALITKSMREHDGILKKLVIRRFSIVTPVFLLPFTAGFIVYGEPFVIYYAGEDFVTAHSYAFLLAIGLYLFNYSGFFMGVCTLQDRSFIKKSAYFNFGAVLLNIPLNYVLIQQYGAIGAVYASFATFLYLSCMLIYTGIKHISELRFSPELIVIYVIVIIVYSTGYLLWDSSYGLMWCFIYSGLSAVSVAGLSMILKEPRAIILPVLYRLKVFIM